MSILFNRNSLLHHQLRQRVAAAQEPLARAALADLADEREWIARLSKAMTVDPVELDLANANTSSAETEITQRDGYVRPAVRYTVRIPFTGDEVLLRHRANESLMVDFEGSIQGSAIVLSGVFNQPADTERVKAWRRQQAGRLEQLVGFANAEVTRHNLTTESMAASAYGARRKTLQDLRDAQGEIGETGI